jgi:hypothetical protein
LLAYGDSRPLGEGMRYTVCKDCGARAITVDERIEEEFSGPT